MTNLEVQIGADSSQLQSEIAKVEKELNKLENKQAAQLKIGGDTTSLQKSIDAAKSKLESLKKSSDSMGQSFGNAQKPIANAGNTLTQFSRIAQDAPFGIMGIGNNLTATAEAFAGLSKQAGGAGGALSAVASSLMGSGGILLAVSLVTTALTVMSQKGLTVEDVFNKLTGNFDQFKKSLSEVNAEAAKESGGQVAMAKAYVNAAQDINLSMSDRLIAVKKLQDEYPAYFGNLSKEQILNGNVSGAVKELTTALIAKAKAQGFSNKIGELAQKEVPLREKEAALIAEIAKKTVALAKAKKESTGFFDEVSWVQDLSNLQEAKKKLADIRDEINGIAGETKKWEDQLNKAVEVGIKTDFVPPPKEKIKKQLREQLQGIAKGIKPLGLESLVAVDPGAFAGTWQKSSIAMKNGFDEMVFRMQHGAKEINEEAFKLVQDLNSILENGFASTFGAVGNAIGEALANGTSVLQATGSSLLSSFGSILSQLGDKMILAGTAAILSATALASFFTPAGWAAGAAAIGIGTALKAAGGFASAKGNSMKSSSGGSKGQSVSAGNSVSSPTSSVSGGGSFNGSGTVVFEISGQSLIGVLSNTLNKNTKLGGTMPAI